MSFFNTLKSIFWSSADDKQPDYHAGDWAENTFGNLENPEPYALAEAINTFLEQMKDEADHIATDLNLPNMKFEYHVLHPQSETEPFIWAIKSDYEKVDHNVFGLKRDKFFKKFNVFTYKNIRLQDAKFIQENNAPSIFSYKTYAGKVHKRIESDKWKTKNDVLEVLKKITKESLPAEYKQTKVRYYRGLDNNAKNNDFVEPNPPV